MASIGISDYAKVTKSAFQGIDVVPGRGSSSSVEAPERISGPKKFWSSPQKDFFNTIRYKQSSVSADCGKRGDSLLRGAYTAVVCTVRPEKSERCVASPAKNRL
jgi:hypothetical protein